MIRLIKPILFMAGCVAWLCIAFLPHLKANAWDKKTVLTLSQPVEVPGLVLPAGQYVFKLLDSQADRHIVQIFNTDETNLYGTFLTIPDYRLEPTDQTVLTFKETAAGAPRALRAWFYPGDDYGEEFVYPNAKGGRTGQSQSEAGAPDAFGNDGDLTKPAKTGQGSPAVAPKETS